MSRTRHHRHQRRQNAGRDLWKPGPTSGWGRCSEAKKLGRRIQRKRDKREMYKALY